MAGKPSIVPDIQSVPEYKASLGGGWGERDGDSYYKISSFQDVKPFLMSIPTDTDLWMFVTSGGGLTCGRVDAEGSLFPYQTVDQLHHAHNNAGPITLIRSEEGPFANQIWEPFRRTKDRNPQIERNLFKNASGCHLIFEEVNHQLGLTFSYRWAGSDKLGWVRTSTLVNNKNLPRRISLLDGLRNVQPFGAPLALLQKSSSLVDAYRRADVDPETGMGIFSLTAGITDRAESLEILKANTVWHSGLEQCRLHLSGKAVEQFRNHQVLASDQVQKGNRTHYLVSTSLDIPAMDQLSWHMVADVGLDHEKISQLRENLMRHECLNETIENAIGKSKNNLIRLIAGADGLQHSAEPGAAAHHFANVLFNSMRGGIFQDNYDILQDDFLKFVDSRNTKLTAMAEKMLATLADGCNARNLFQAATDFGNQDLQRLCLEYLPLHFGRRHGDPSRPWNQFSINVRQEDGSQMLDYQGNWRDIFQNWEALATSYPDFLPHFVAKFLNASTVDGNNPYRLSRAGVDWEIEVPDDPWSNIGYWGDHQIIYLLKFLEAWQQHDPGIIEKMVPWEIFSFSQVPYRIKPFDQILDDPSDTISFDQALDKKIQTRVQEIGNDGKLVCSNNGEIYHANLFEKLLIPALAKLGNYVPGAGIWMNTQRPEWNDANNALAGGGVSVVTMGYLRRYLKHLTSLSDRMGDIPIPVSQEVFDWFEETARIFSNSSKNTLNITDSRSRFKVLTALGEAYSQYRQTVYSNGFSGRRILSTEWVSSILKLALEQIDLSLKLNERPDGLFHSYNLLNIDLDAETIKINHLPMMLEGQVAILSSGVISSEQSVEVVDALFNSRLFRSDQNSFILYPEVELPSFLDKNRVPEENALSISLVESLLESGDKSLILRDAQGQLRFTSQIQNQIDVENLLNELESDGNFTHQVQNDRAAVLQLFESVFNHDRYTGRSGQMYGYEGIGCIYWHMVAKLLLAVQETWEKAADEKETSAETQSKLKSHYCRIREGLGWRKTVNQYGAFPSDPYSHTPGDGGARQPGMTGQVKEEILTRRGELGLQVRNGQIGFRPGLLASVELLNESGSFEYYDHKGQLKELSLSKGSMAFTCCQVPVIYEKTRGESWVQLLLSDGSEKMFKGQEMDSQSSRAVFSRTGWVKRIRVGIAVEA
ncbi:MAG: hypothetical protein GY780_09020 [bacterium]|nr:hypothetical protein [bacterium]